jgi:hypothetical protein
MGTGRETSPTGGRSKERFTLLTALQRNIGLKPPESMNLRLEMVKKA